MGHIDGECPRNGIGLWLKPSAAQLKACPIRTVDLHGLALSCSSLHKTGGLPQTVGTTWGDVLGEVLRIGHRGRGDEVGTRAKVQGHLGVKLNAEHTLQV